MLLLPPEVYNRLKDEIEESANQSIFDRAMNKILKNKNFSDSEKWYNYRNQLIAFLNLNRKSRHSFDKKPSQEHSIRQQNSLRDNTTQTKFIFKDDMHTQTSPLKDILPPEKDEPFNFGEDVFEIEKTPPRRSLSPATKRRLSASGIAKSVKPPAKIQKTDTSKKDYKIVTGNDGITQYTIPMDIDDDDVASYIEDLEKPQKKQPILRPSQKDPGQYMISFPTRKAVRQSERLKSKSRSTSGAEIPWERL